jgi:hypothetical protein
MDTKKNKYLIYATTNLCWIAQYIVGMIVPIIVILNFNHEVNLATYLVSFALLNGILWLIVRKYLLQPIVITLTEERIYLKYLSFNSKKTKKEVSVSINKISGFSDFTVNQELKFKLYFSQGQTFTLHKDGLWNRKDDFELLINDFKIYIEKLNVKSSKESKRILKKKIKYGDNTYLNFVLYCLALAFILGLSFLLSESKEVNVFISIIGFLIILTLGLLHFFRYRDSNENTNED